MSESLEALNKLVSHIETEYHDDDYYECKNAKDIIEKELKAFEIIKETWNITFFDEEQRITIDSCYSITFKDKNKYDLLKGELE